MAGTVDGPYELPAGYGVNRLGLLVRDPRCVFAFWEVTAGGWEAAVRRLPPGGEPPRLVLQVRDRPHESARATLGRGAPGVDECVREYTVAGADQWYVHLDGPGRAVAAVIGARSGSAFVPIARSPTVHTPPGTVCPQEAGEWLTIQAIYGRLAGGPAGATSPGLWARLALSRDDAVSSPSSWGQASWGEPAARHGRAPVDAALVIDTELIVYGRVSDGAARVSINGQPVTVRPDGSFGFRCALPEGTLVLPVEARFPGGQRRFATPVVTRETY